MQNTRQSVIALGFLITFIIACKPQPGPIEKTVLPTEYAQNRFYVTPVTPGGDTLRLYTDTGGGTNMIWPETIGEFGLDTTRSNYRGKNITVTSFPAFQPDAAIPAPTQTTTPLGRKLAVMEPKLASEFSGHGFLGAPWFGTRIWEFNYPDRSLALVEEIDWAARSEDHRIHLGFREDSTGNKINYHPRMTMVVDGDSIDVLFDTGATTFPTESAAQQLGFPEASAIGTSFIIDSLFQSWQEDHPDWEVIQNAERTTGQPMIRVPEVTVAGYIVGPVWFTVRPTRSFTQWMSQWTDKPVYGALGGSAFQYFRIIVDYPKEIAEFLLPESS